MCHWLGMFLIWEKACLTHSSFKRLEGSSKHCAHVGKPGLEGTGAGASLVSQMPGALCCILSESQRELCHRFLLTAPVEGDFFSSELLAQGWTLGSCHWLGRHTNLPRQETCPIQLNKSRGPCFCAEEGGLRSSQANRRQEDIEKKAHLRTFVSDGLQ